MRGLISLMVLVLFVLICVLVVWMVDRYNNYQREVVKRAWEPSYATLKSAYVESNKPAGDHVWVEIKLYETHRNGTKTQIDKQEVGHVDPKDKDYDTKFDALWDRAISRMYRLNATLEPFA